MAKYTDVALIGGLALIAVVAYKGIGGFLNNFKNPLENVQFPSINISNPFTLSNPISTTYPDTSAKDLAFLESIKQGFASQNKTLEEYTKALVSNLTPLGSAGNPADSPTTPTPIDVILNDKTLSESQKREALDIITPNEQSDLTKFNPPNVFGYGILGEQGKGIPLSLARDLNLVGKTADQITAQQKAQLSQINVNEDIYKILYGQAGVSSLSQFFKAFNIPYLEQSGSVPPRPNSIMEVNSGVKLDTSTIVKPAGGQFGGSVYLPAGTGFVGGTIYENPVDTLTEVLSIFPNLSASQARDVLSEIKNINPRGLNKQSVLALFPTGDVINLSGSLGQTQIFNNNSLSIANATPQYISNLLQQHLA